MVGAATRKRLGAETSTREAATGEWLRAMVCGEIPQPLGRLEHETPWAKNSQKEEYTKCR